MRRVFVLGSVALLGVAPQAQAQQPWEFQITPYVWGPSLDAEARLGSRLPPLEFERSLHEILEDLEMAFFLTGTARRGRLLLFGDLTYSDLSEGHRWELLPPTQITPEIDLEVDIDLGLTAATFGAGWSVVDRPDLVVDLFAGARFWRVDLEVDVPNRIPRVPDSFSESESWTDPLIGVRARYQFDPKWSVTGYADYGGFGIGSDSTWQVFATLNYRISERWSASAGYRALAFDYDHDDFALDTTLGGAVFGATYRF